MNWRWLGARAIFYPTLWWAMFLARFLHVRNWWDKVDPNVIIGAFPFASDVDALAKEGVGSVVNTCEEYGGPVEEYEKHGIRQIRIPTIDFTHPLYEDVQRAVDFMIKEIDEGRTVYVHCKAGRARSATVVLCWLIQAKKMTAAEGQALLLKHRPHVNPRLPSREAVQKFEQLYLSKGTP